MKDAGVGDDKDEDNEDDDDGKRGAAADNQNLNPHLQSICSTFCLTVNPADSSCQKLEDVVTVYPDPRVASKTRSKAGRVRSGCGVWAISCSEAILPPCYITLATKMLPDLATLAIMAMAMMIILCTL